MQSNMAPLGEPRGPEGWVQELPLSFGGREAGTLRHILSFEILPHAQPESLGN